MIRFIKLRLPLAAAASLLPLLAPGESQLASLDQGSGSRQAVATAHVMFKIVIPQALSMEFEGLEPHRILLRPAGHRTLARVESCLPAEAAHSAPTLSCTVSTP